MQHESLITIPNRFVFLEQIEQRVQDEPEQSLLLIDVVRFSDVSTAFGHQYGDRILLDIANRIRLLFSDKCLLGRIDGDVFGLMIPGLHQQEKLHQYYLHLVEHFKTPLQCDDHSFIADFNVGAAANPINNTNINTFFSLAETALKQAKNNKFDNFQFTYKLNNKESGRSLTLKADLTRAINNNELELYYQPKINLNNLQVIGAEGLLRWNHPLDGLLFPGALIEAAESFNMMNELGYWVLEQAFKGIAYLNCVGLDLIVSVNMSPSQLYDLGFVQKLVDMSRMHGIDLTKLELELTEDVALSNSVLVKKQLSQIRALGVSIAIDDFGKGYSNLAYFRDIKIDNIKIDKSFIMQIDQGPVNKAIVEASLVIAKAAQCEVIAEGIETVQHLHCLREIGILSGQGFLFSKAIPLSEFVELANKDIIIGSSYTRSQYSA